MTAPGGIPPNKVAELAISQGKRVHLFSIDAQLAQQELTYAERAIWKKRSYELGVTTTFDHEIDHVERRGNRLVAFFRNMLTGQLVEREADKVIIERGTLPADQVYQELRQDSGNDGVTDIDARCLAAKQPRPARPGSVRTAPDRRRRRQQNAHRRSRPRRAPDSAMSCSTLRMR